MTVQNLHDSPKADQVHSFLLELASKVCSDRRRPLLVLFYPGDLSISEEQIEQLHIVLTQRGLSRGHPLDALDVLIHTYGGEPTAAYRLAQVIRNFSKNVEFLVPEYAFSGGTIICLSGDKILLGDYAVLSPIDITLHRSTDDQCEEEPKFPTEQETEEIELVAIDHFIKVAVQARIEIEREFRLKGFQEAKSQVESEMLRQMVEELGVIEIGKFYREKNLTQAYASELLTSYMFTSKQGDDPTIEGILRRLIVESPSHGFPMDYHICRDIGLDVAEMEEELADDTRNLTRHLQAMVSKGLICDRNSRPRLPFFELFGYSANNSGNAVVQPITEAKPYGELRNDNEYEREESNQSDGNGAHGG